MDSKNPMKTIDFEYELPEELIAQTPLPRRDLSRLLVVNRPAGSIEDRKFADLNHFLSAGDLLVANDSRVINARLFGHKRKTGGKVELLLLSQLGPNEWKALIGGRNMHPGVEIVVHDLDGLETDIVATTHQQVFGSQHIVTFNKPTEEFISRTGHVPLPPYIHTHLQDPERYQTVYADRLGSSAAPTAGLHFTQTLISELKSNGVLFETCTLHVGLDTFKPVEVETVSDHTIHSEWISLSQELADQINVVHSRGNRVVAVGTTAARVLETVALRSSGAEGSLQKISQSDELESGKNKRLTMRAFEGTTDLYIYPGYRFRVVDALITNFHLPKSSLMMMISAFAGLELVKQAYARAIEHRYRFLSLGDAMLIL
jgi:S-adenosylmethionine:tRNA ribosyltransferase-isomerase